MKYIVLIHSNPQPWGHPTGDFVAEHQALPREQREKMTADFEALCGELEANGELVSAAPLGDPARARIYRWSDGPVASDGPYSESKEHLAGYFVLDLETSERAEQVAARFAGPGETIELRPLMTGGGPDQ